jgi:hypothetical protein
MRIMLRSSVVALALLTAAPAFAQPAPGGWDLNRRESWLQERIDRGRGDGSLDRREARRVQRQLGRIRHDQAWMRRRDGGQLTDVDRTALERRLDDLSDHIRWARHNDERRPW